MATTLERFTKTETGLASLGANGGAVAPSADVLKEALATASLPATDLDGLRVLQRRLMVEQDAALGIEVTLKRRLANELVEVGNAIAAAQVNKARDGSKLSHLDLEVLRWRHPRVRRGEVPRPQVALIETSHAAVRFRAVRGSFDEVKVTPTYQNATLDFCYLDVNEALVRKTRQTRRMVREANLAFQFEGVIPAASRAVIQQARTVFPAVFLLVDSPHESWSYTTMRETIRQRMARLDPLILGFGAEKLWVLDAFDATAVEQYIQAEFTSKT